MPNPSPGGFLKPKHPKVATPEQPADPYADLYGYVTPPGKDAGFWEQAKYINRTSPEVFMQLGAGLMAGDTAGGLSNAAQALSAGTEQQRRAQLGLYKHQEGEKAKNLTRQWLIGQGISPEDAEAAMANPAILSELLKPPDKRNLITVGDRLYDADTDTWIDPGGAGGGFDLGTGTDARALEYLVDIGKLTKEQAAEVAGGRPVTLSDGSVIFQGASELAGGAGKIIIQPPGGQPEVVDPDAPGDGGAAAPAAPSPGGGAGAGGTILSPPKSAETTEQRNKKSQAKIAKQTLYDQLDAYTELVKTYGVEAASGAGMDELNIARSSIITTLKDLYTLGALTGPDLGLVSSQIYDPIIDLKEKGPLTTAGQLLTASFGDPGARAKSAADALKKQIEIMTNAQLGIPTPGALPKVSTQADFDALPSGTRYINTKTGQEGIKP